jgi:hypothetical protein
MIAFPAGVKVWIAGGVTDMRRGMNTLALQVRAKASGVIRMPAKYFASADVVATWSRFYGMMGSACRST